MKTFLAFLVLAAVTMAPLAGPFTATVPDTGSQSSPEDAIRPVSDQAAESIRGALAWKWRCAITSFALGVGALSAAPLTGGVSAIAAPVLFNAAAFCLI